MNRRHFTAALLLLLASCAAPQAAPPAPATWRVTSYNIHVGKGTDTVLDLERIARVLERTNADAIALQEVDDRTQRTGRVDQAKWLAERLRMTYVYGPAMEFQGGRYGVAVLTKHRVIAQQVVRLPDGNEPRVAVAVEIEQPGGARATFVAVHLDHVANDTLRYAQAQRLAQFLDGIGGPWILAGDFNDEPDSRTIALFAARALEAAKPAGARYTFPAGTPAKEIDFIFAAPAGAWRATAVEVVNEPVASDHRPVVATLLHTGAR